MNNDLISRKYVIAELLKERERFPPMVAERYSFGVKLPHRFNQAMRGGIRKGLRIVETAPAVDAVSPGVLEQYKWERDTVIAQLEELGIGFGQKKPDMVKVVRCIDCYYGKYLDKHTILCASEKMCPTRVSPDFFCADGKAKMDAEDKNVGCGYYELQGDGCMRCRRRTERPMWKWRGVQEVE